MCIGPTPPGSFAPSNPISFGGSGLIMISGLRLSNRRMYAGPLVDKYTLLFFSPMCSP